jgi:hypothetical protein
LVGRPQRKRLLENKNACWWITLGWILETKWDGVDWIDLAQDRDNWRALVNAVMILSVP